MNDDDPLEILLEEVSLEGLDGITLTALWLRLETRQNTKLKPLDNHWKQFYFDLLKSHPNISSYELPKERELLAVFDIKEYIEPYTHMYIEPSIDKIPVDIYPYVAINDEEKGVMGSCSTYGTRKNTTDEIKKYSYDRVCEIYGNKLVFVASQQLRAKYLMITKKQYAPSSFDLSLHGYCILERIGRCRQYGCLDITRESVKLPPKDIFYHRKELLHRKWISRQTISKQKKNGGIMRYNLYYLNRYHVDHKSKLTNFMQTILEALKNSSSTDYILPVKSFNHVFGSVSSLSVKKLVNFFHMDDKIKELDLPYSRVFPLLPLNQCFTLQNKERQAPCIQLLDPGINIEKELKKDFDKLDEVESEEEEDEADDGNIQDWEEEQQTEQEIFETQSQQSWLSLVEASTNVDAVSDLSESESLASCTDMEDSYYSGEEFGEETMEVSFLKKKDCLIEKEVPFELSLRKHFMKVVEQAGSKGCSALQIQRKMKLSRIDIRNLIKHGAVYLNIYIKDEGRQRTQYFRLKKYSNSDSKYHTNTSSIVCDIPCKKMKLESHKVTEPDKNSIFGVDYGELAFHEDEKPTTEKKHPKTDELTSVFPTDLQRSRACDAIDYINEIGFTLKFTQLYNYIFEKDKTRNITVKIDRKTVRRLLDKLGEHGFIKIVDVVVKTDTFIQTEKSVRVYADNEFDTESESFRATVQKEQLKISDTKTLYISPNNIQSENEVKTPVKSEEMYNTHDIKNDDVSYKTKAKASTEQNGVTDNFNEYIDAQLQKEDNSSHVELKLFKNITVEINTIQPTKQPIKNLKHLYPTDLMSNRAADCLQFIQENIVVVGTNSIQNFIKKRDVIRKYHAKIDLRTIKRLMEKLSLNNFIKCFLVKFKNLNNGSEKDVYISTVLDITQEHSQFSNAIKKEKLLFVGESSSQPSKAQPPKSSDYISLPKFGKMENMHKIAFHVAYSSIKAIEDQEVARNNLERNARVNIPSDHPVIYNDTELNDFTFLPSLSPPNSYPRGFLNFQDFYSLLPVGTLLQSLGRDSIAHSLDEYYRDPVRRFYPIKDTDTSVYTLLTRQQDGRKNVSTVYNIFVNLAVVGLVQLGKRFGVEKENFVVYVNQKTSLRDTMIATPSYIELDKNTLELPTIYELHDIFSVKKYWLDSAHICLNTPLGHRSFAIGQKVNSYKRISDKPILSEACKHYDDINIILSRDNGQVPGDGLGAAGYDSSVFAHMKKNWNAISKIIKSPTVVKPTRHTDNLKGLLRKKENSDMVKKPKVIERIVKARVVNEKKSKIIENSSISGSSRRRLRTQITWNDSDSDVLHLIHIMYKAFKLKKCNRLTRDILVKLLNKKSKTKTILSAKMLLSHYCRVLKIAENKERYSLLEAEVNHRVEVRNFLIPHIKKHRELCCDNDKTRAHRYIFDNFLQIVKTVFEMVVVDYNALKNDDFPTSYEQLVKEYKTVDAKEELYDLYPAANNQNNIKIHVLLNLIHSSLASGSYMKHENINTCLFEAYERYSESLIHKAIRILKKLQIIASTRYITKQLQPKKKPTARTHPTPIPISRFKFSLRYINKLGLTEMQCSSFHESYLLFKQVSQSTDSIQTIVQVDSGCLNLLIALLSKDVKFDIEIPDTLLLFDPKLQKKNQTIVDRYYELVDYYTVGTVGKSFSENEGDDNDEDEDDDKQGNIPPMTLFNAARLAMYTLKDVLIKEHISTQHVHKLFTLNTCKILLGEVHSLVGQYEHCKSEAYIRKLSLRILVPALNQEQINAVLTPGLEKELEQFIANKLEAGATSEDIRIKFGANQKVKSTLDRLVDKQIIIRTGCALVTYVHNTSCSLWLLKIVTDHTSKSVKECIIAPWIHVNSCVNRPVLDYMLCVVLGYIIFNPGVALLTLQEHFASVLQPTHIIDLLDVLVHLQCIFVQFVTTVQPTLFTKGSVKVAPATLLEPSDSIYIEAMFDAGLKLGVFIGEKSYQEDYLQDIIRKNVEIED